MYDGLAVVFIFSHVRRAVNYRVIGFAVEFRNATTSAIATQNAFPLHRSGGRRRSFGINFRCQTSIRVHGQTLTLCCRKLVLPGNRRGGRRTRTEWRNRDKRGERFERIQRFERRRIERRKWAGRRPRWRRQWRTARRRRFRFPIRKIDRRFRSVRLRQKRARLRRRAKYAAASREYWIAGRSKRRKSS